MGIKADVKKTWHDGIVELFELDLSVITGTNDDKFYFTASLMPDDSKIFWKGQRYEPLPIYASGFERTTKGQTPTPELTVANVLGTLADVVNNLDDLIGAKVTRHRTLYKYLDNSTNPDPSQEFPDDIFYIERKTAETSITITWQLASKIDLEGLQLPKRVITQNYCLWDYRGSECGYSGPAIANEYDKPITVGGSQSPQGQAYLAAYEAFDAAKGALATAEARKNNLKSIKEAACDPDTFGTLETRFIFSYRQPESILLPPSNDTYSFVIENGAGNPVVAMWNGQAVDVSGERPEYRAGFTQNTGRGPGSKNNGTGDLYYVNSYIFGQQGGLFAVEDFSFSTFAMLDANQDVILIVNGSVVERRLDEESPGYDIGRFVYEGFKPMRSISRVDYENSKCEPATEAFQEAKDEYQAAKIAFDAAEAALAAAYAALPSGDGIRSRDKCGKRLQSCRLRFGLRGALPFGGFPGATLTR